MYTVFILKSFKKEAAEFYILYVYIFRSEWKKILSGNFAGPLTLKMIEVGLAPFIGLPKDPNIGEMEKVWNDIQVNFATIDLNSGSFCIHIYSG